MMRFCCMSLNTASVMIGWIGAAGSFLFSIGLVVVFLYDDDFFDSLDSNYQSYCGVGYNYECYKILENARFFFTIFTSILLALSVISLVASAFLVAGTIKKRHLMLTPFLINSGIYLVLTFMFAIAVTTGLIEYPGTINPQFIIFCVVIIGFQLSVWYPVYSLYKQYKTDSECEPLLAPLTYGISKMVY